MKKIVHPLVRRWRAESSSELWPPSVSLSVSVSVSARKASRPFRLWMTGSLAVVMAAMIPLRAASAAERSQAMRLLRHSPYDVAETLHRIEVAARDRGLSVLAKVAGTPPVLVLAASIGGTLVVMHGPGSRPAMPLGPMVSESAAGGADVLVAKARSGGDGSDWSELPASVVDDLRALPDVVDRALG